jgi:hypothetical protein
MLAINPIVVKTSMMDAEWRSNFHVVFGIGILEMGHGNLARQPLITT